MDPDAAFEQAILADPSDRTAQLVYADWLDEHDDPAFAAAVRSEAFVGVPAAATEAGVSLREAWAAARGVRRLSGSVGAVGLAAVLLAPVLRAAGGALRAAALGAALSGPPARPSPAPAHPVVRRES